MRIPLRAPRRLALAGLLGLAGIFSAPALTQAAVPSEKSLPGTTFGYIKVENAAKLREMLKSTQFGKLLADPAMKPLKDDLVSKLEDQSQKLKQKIGVTIDELASLPQGEISLAVVSKDDPKTPFVVLLALDGGKNAKELDSILAKSTKLAEQDATVTTETFKDLKLTVIRSKKKEDGKEEPPLVWTRQGDVFHIATDTEALKDVLSNVNGRADSLAANEPYAQVVKKVGKNAQFLWYFDIGQVFKLIGQNVGAQGAGNAAQIEAQLQLTGLNSLKAIGGGTAINVGEFDLLTKTFVYSPGPPQGLLKVFSLPKADLKPQPWVPANVATYQALSWDLDNAYTAINELADMFAPGVLANVEKQIAGPNGEELSFQKDIFGPLGNRITVISDIKKPTGDKKPATGDDKGQPPVNQRYLFAIALDDPKAFQTTFNKALAISKLSPKKREFRGTTIYDFELPEVPNAPTAGVNGPASVAIAKGNLFISFEPTFLEQILRGEGATLADSPAYQAVAKQYPDQSSTLTYQDPDEQARSLYDAIKSGDLKKVLENANKPDKGPDLAKLAGLIDPNKLPEFSIFAKYLSQGGGFGVVEDDGATFTSFSLKK